MFSKFVNHRADWKNKDMVCVISQNKGYMDEINDLLLYLASDNSYYIIGQVFVVDRGQTAN
jgi:enoyl-[acyl-carrier-protein] reductase (NADH)